MYEIDREKTIEGLKRYLNYPKPLCDVAQQAITLLKEQEQAMKEKDGTISNLIAQIKEISQCYERVVRCKDCEHGRMINILNYTCTKSQNHCEHILHSPDWFCADGRKKDD